MNVKHFTDLEDIAPVDVRWILDRARDFKAAHAVAPRSTLMAGRYVGLLFEMPATRTRLHFETATRDMGGDVISFQARDTPMDRGETVGDTARVLSRHCDVIMYRTGRHQRLLDFAEASSAPVINGCTDYSHPFRPLVEVMTYEEERGAIAGKTVAFMGDCFMNQATSWIHTAVKLGFTLKLGCPDAFGPRPEVLRWAQNAGGDVSVVADADEAVAGADYVCTDIWFPMGSDNRDERRQILGPYQVNARLMGLAKPDALFMHPLAASRGDEVTDGVLDGPQSVVWTGGIENKRHLIKSLYAWLLDDLVDQPRL